MSDLFKVGTHRGNKRVWFQGGKLVQASFAVGLPYTVSIHHDCIILALTAIAPPPVNPVGEPPKKPKPTRKVSKKPSKNGPIPVIDLNSKAISVFFDEAVQCSVRFGTGWIEIKPVSVEP